MRTDTLTPGIYILPHKDERQPAGMERRCVAGFVGVTEKGPLNVPVRMADFSKFLGTFGGFSGPGSLPFSVYGFFNSGGKECVVVRVARQEGEGSVSTASTEMRGTGLKPIGTLEASSPGSWGNRLAVKMWHSAELRFKADSCAEDEIGVTVADGEPLPRAGDVIRIQREGTATFSRVKAVKDTEVVFSVPLAGLRDHIASDGRLETISVNVCVQDGARSEDYFDLSPNPSAKRYFPDFVNAVSERIRVRMDDAESIPLEIQWKALRDGHDGVMELAAADFIGTYAGLEKGAGIGLLEGFQDISVIAAPDVALIPSFRGVWDDKTGSEIKAVQQALLSQAERLPNRFALLDVPQECDTSEAIKWAANLDSAFASLHFPFIDMIDPSDTAGISTVRVPPSGFIAGILADFDAKEGSMRAPANAFLPGVVGVGRKLMNAEIAMVQSGKVNTFKVIPGRGVKAWGARTLSSDPEWRFINVRRTVSRISLALKESTRWAVFEPNTIDLRKRLARTVSAFLLDVWRQGYLAGTTPDEAFFLRCGEEENPPENIERGIVTVAIGLAVVKPTEFIMITLRSEQEGANVNMDDEILSI